MFVTFSNPRFVRGGTFLLNSSFSTIDNIDDFISQKSVLCKMHLTVALCAINNISFQKLLTSFVQLLKVAIKFKNKGSE